MATAAGQGRAAPPAASAALAHSAPVRQRPASPAPTMPSASTAACATSLSASWLRRLSASTTCCPGSLTLSSASASGTARRTGRRQVQQVAACEHRCCCQQQEQAARTWQACMCCTAAAAGRRNADTALASSVAAHQAARRTAVGAPACEMPWWRRVALPLQSAPGRAPQAPGARPAGAMQGSRGAGDMCSGAAGAGAAACRPAVSMQAAQGVCHLKSLTFHAAPSSTSMCSPHTASSSCTLSTSPLPAYAQPSSTTLKARAYSRCDGSTAGVGSTLRRGSSVS